MSEGGYVPHMVGKWDAGAATPDHTPLGRGYTSSLGYFSHQNDYYTYAVHQDKCKEGANTTILRDLWDTNKPAWHLADGTYEEEIFWRRGEKVLQNHDISKPLFLFYAFHIVHQPLEVPKAYLDKFSFIKDSVPRKTYHAMVNYADDVVGNLTNLLKSKGMWENTLIVATADNGGWIDGGAGGNNYPLRGGKYTDWEGGTRVNAFISGGYVPDTLKGSVLDGYIHGADWYGTFCHLAGVDPTDHRAAAAGLPPIDSYNVWPYVSGSVATSPRNTIHLSPDALIDGDWKILVGDMALAGWQGPVYPNGTAPNGVTPPTLSCTPACLFNIRQDPTEHVDLAKVDPSRVDRMIKELNRLNVANFNPKRGRIDPEACKKAVEDYKGFLGPWVP